MLWNFSQDFRNLYFSLLGNNKLKSIKNENFKNLTSLKRLYLNTNQIVSIEDKAFNDVESLETLALSMKRFLNSWPFFTHCSFLTDDNLLSSLPETVFQKLKSLKILYFNQNLILTLPPDVFLGLSSLEDLQLSINLELIFFFLYFL